MERDMETPTGKPTPAPRHMGTFDEFKAFTLAVVRGEQVLDPNAPKIWVESTEQDGAFSS